MKLAAACAKPVLFFPFVMLFSLLGAQGAIVRPFRARHFVCCIAGRYGEKARELMRSSSDQGTALPQRVVLGHPGTLPKFLPGTPPKNFSDSRARGADSGTKCEQDPTLTVLYPVMVLLDKVFGHLSGAFLTLCHDFCFKSANHAPDLWEPEPSSLSDFCI